LAHGTATAHGYRVFETGKRPAWKNARQAVLDLDAQLNELKKEAKSKKKNM